MPNNYIGKILLFIPNAIVVYGGTKSKLEINMYSSDKTSYKIKIVGLDKFAKPLSPLEFKGSFKGYKNVEVWFIPYKLGEHLIEIDVEAENKRNIFYVKVFVVLPKEYRKR